MVEGLLHDSTVGRIGNRIQCGLGFAVGIRVHLDLTRHICHVGMDYICESDFPVGRVILVQGKKSHILLA